MCFPRTCWSCCPKRQPPEPTRLPTVQWSGFGWEPQTLGSGETFCGTTRIATSQTPTGQRTAGQTTESAAVLLATTKIRDVYRSVMTESGWHTRANSSRDTSANTILHLTCKLSPNAKIGHVLLLLNLSILRHCFPVNHFTCPTRWRRTLHDLTAKERFLIR